MERRDFMRVVMAGTAGSLVLPREALAGQSADRFAGSVYYTEQAPGRWAKKVGGHLPKINVKREGSDSVIEVVTGHEMKGFEHYIVKHVLLDAQMQLLGETMFDPNKDSPYSSYRLPAYSGMVYALSMCNKHDTWMNMIEV